MLSRECGVLCVNECIFLFMNVLWVGVIFICLKICFDGMELSFGVMDLNI